MKLSSIYELLKNQDIHKMAFVSEDSPNWFSSNNAITNALPYRAIRSGAKP